MVDRGLKYALVESGRKTKGENSAAILETDDLQDIPEDDDIIVLE